MNRLKKSKFELGKLRELMVNIMVLENPSVMRQMLNLNRLGNMSPPSKNLFKIQTFLTGHW
jgi:hypothetical protein